MRPADRARVPSSAWVIVQQAAQNSMLADWFETPKGGYVLAWERGQFDAAVEDVFGPNAVQLGLPRLNFLRKASFPFTLRAGAPPTCHLPQHPYPPHNTPPRPHLPTST